MTQHIETLKGILQKALNSSVEGKDFKDAISDAIYSCQFETVVALECWLNSWSRPIVEITKDEIQYQQGVQFVAEQWDRILSESNEGED